MAQAAIAGAGASGIASGATNEVMTEAKSLLGSLVNRLLGFVHMLVNNAMMFMLDWMKRLAQDPLSWAILIGNISVWMTD